MSVKCLVNAMPYFQDTHYTISSPYYKLQSNSLNTAKKAGLWSLTFHTWIQCSVGLLIARITRTLLNTKLEVIRRGMTRMLFSGRRYPPLPLQWEGGEQCHLHVPAGQAEDREDGEGAECPDLLSHVLQVPVLQVSFPDGC